jgi:NitT/TauT family transport system substrate-binding protein
MKRRSRLITTLGVVGLAGLLVACGDDDDDSASTTAASEATTAGTDGEATAETTAETTADTTAGTDGQSGETSGSGLVVDTDSCVAPEGDSIKLQLQWVAQAQFGGYYAAVDQGFYEDAGLDVEIVELGTDMVPATQLATGAVDFAISWVPKALAVRETGAKVTNIAQIFQRSGTLQVAFKDAGITSVEDFEGKRIGNWGFGNEYEIFAALTEAGLDPASDITLVKQDFNMEGLLNNDIDAAEAMTYNEYAQVLESVNPDTGELYTADDLDVISYEEVGVGMLQDAIWADEAKLADPAYCGQAIAFVKASIEGWLYCRENPEDCRDIVVAAGSTLGASHQLWQMNEVNKLIWPASAGIGVIDDAAWDRTVTIAQNTKNDLGQTVLTKEPDPTSWTNDIVLAALDQLGDDVDLVGSTFEPIEVTLVEGGN